MRSIFEPLESRKLMTASLVNGVLTVTGTGLDDVITISQDNFSPPRSRERQRWRQRL